MGIPAPLISFLLKESAYRPWSGRLLTLGKQTVLADPKTLRRIWGRHYYYVPGEVRLECGIDRTTITARQNPDRAYVDDASLFALLGVRQFDVLDVTDYEGANLIHNLCEPLPPELIGQFDIVFNGSVLDNVFDPAAALRNITQLLTPTGRVIHIEMASNLAFEYLIYSTDWFLDYYVVNGFIDCRVYVCSFETVDELLYGPWQVHAYMPRPDGTAFSLRDLKIKQAALVVIAEKAPHSTVDAVPVQWNYRDDAMKQAYCERLAQLSENRPVFGFGRSPQRFADLKLGGFLDCGLATG